MMQETKVNSEVGTLSRKETHGKSKGLFPKKGGKKVPKKRPNAPKEKKAGIIRKFASTKLGKITIAGAIATSLFGATVTYGAEIVSFFNKDAGQELAQNVEGLKQDLYKSIRNFENIKAERNFLLQQSKETSGAVADKDKQIQELTATIEGLNAQIATLEEGNAEKAVLAQQVTELTTQVQSLTAEKQSLEDKETQLKADIEHANNLVGNLNDELTQAKSTYQQFVDKQYAEDYGKSDRVKYNDKIDVSGME